jgi:hypothetical protein
MPSSPTRNWKKKVTLKPTRNVQKWSLPRRSDSSRPVILGNQK